MSTPLPADKTLSDNFFSLLIWLRAIAALLVVIHHSALAARSQLSAADTQSTELIANFLGLGTFAVYLFFTLSGCTLVLSNHKKIHGLRNVVGFCAKRFMRIWPVYFFSILIYMIFISVFRHFYSATGNNWIELFLVNYTTKDVIQYLLLTFNINGTPDLFNSSYWSLPIEFQYYMLLAPALFFMQFKYFDVIIPLLLAITLYLMYQHNSPQINDPRIYKMGYSFFGGALIAVLLPYVTFRFRIKFFMLFLSVCIVFLGCIRTDLITANKSYPFISDDWNVFGIVAIAIVGLAVITSKPEKHSKAIEFVEHYGEISYSIYLFHMLFIGVAILMISYTPVLQGVNKFIFILLFSLTGSYFFSLLSYKYLEKRSIKFGRTFDLWITKRSIHAQHNVKQV